MNPWVLSYEGFDPASEGLREALCTLGNGRFATRGATPDGELRTPGTYVAGCYDRLDSTVAGRTVTNEDLVNLPDWLPLTYAAPGSDWFRPERADLLEYRQKLDMRHGILYRALRWRDGSGRITAIRQHRLVSMADPRLAALETTAPLRTPDRPADQRWPRTETVAGGTFGGYRNRASSMVQRMNSPSAHRSVPTHQAPSR